MRATTVRQDTLDIGRVTARGSQRLTSFAPSAQDLAAASVDVPFPIYPSLPRLARPLLKDEIAHAWIPTMDANGAVQLAVTPCPVLGQLGGVIELDCSIEPGASGSPLFVRDQDSVLFAGVIVARGQDDTAGIAVATHAHLLLELSLPDLQ